MRASKKLLLGLAVLAVSVMGMQSEEECKVCKKDPLGLSDCWDVRLDDDLQLRISDWEYTNSRVVDGVAVPYIQKYINAQHSGARMQWSTNSIDWSLFNHCRGVGIQPNLNQFTFRHGVGFPVGGSIDLHNIGRINWEKHVYEGPTVTKFFIRLLPCDVNAHKEAYKNRKIEIETTNRSLQFLYGSKTDPEGTYNYHMRSGLTVNVKWSYGVLQFTKSLNQKDIKWENCSRAYERSESFRPQFIDPRFDGHYRYGHGAFFRIKPINEDAFKVFYIGLDEDIIREEKPVSNISVLAPPPDLK